MNGTIYFDEAQDLTDEMLEELDMLIPESAKAHFYTATVRPSFYRRHEGKILLIILCLTLLGLYLILPYIPTIMWELSTLIMRVMGWQPQ